MAQACRDGIRKAKAQLDLDIVKGNKKDFYKYTGNKRKTRPRGHGSAGHRTYGHGKG